MNAHTPTANPATAGALMRPADVCRVTGLGLSTLYAHIDRGMFPKPVALSRRFVVFPQEEVTAVINARIAGADDKAIKALVAEITEARKRRV